MSNPRDVATKKANTIQLKGGYRLEEGFPYEEVMPGALVELRSDMKIQNHSTEGGYAERAFAVEDALQGKTINDPYDPAAKTASPVQYHLEEPGAEIQALIQAGQEVSPGDLLISGGDGTLIKLGTEHSLTEVKQVLAVAMEEVDLSASDAVDTLAVVRIL